MKPLKKDDDMDILRVPRKPQTSKKGVPMEQAPSAGGQASDMSRKRLVLPMVAVQSFLDFKLMPPQTYGELKDAISKVRLV
jgi:hypothetical protein